MTANNMMPPPVHKIAAIAQPGGASLFHVGAIQCFSDNQVVANCLSIVILKIPVRSWTGGVWGLVIVVNRTSLVLRGIDHLIGLLSFGSM
jgi:hypothetical protein